MKRLKKWFKRNKLNMAFSIIVALMIKFVADMSRFYSAFGGEDLLLIGVIGYWILRWHYNKEYVKDEQ